MNPLLMNNKSQLSNNFQYSTFTGPIFYVWARNLMNYKERTMASSFFNSHRRTSEMFKKAKCIVFHPTKIFNKKRHLLITNLK
jgi:hypothetical protein